MRHPFKALLFDLFLATLMMLTGCASDAQHELRPTKMKMLIDPAFTYDQQADILNAMQEWEQVTTMVFLAKMAPCEGKLDDEVCIHAVKRTTEQKISGSSGSLGFCSWTEDSAEVWLSVDFFGSDDTYFTQMAAHELGHAMGLAHSTDPGIANTYYNGNPFESVMYPYVGGGTLTPSFGDVKQWYELHEDE